MGGIEQCANVLDTWIKAPSIDRKNIFMRAFAYNQKDLMKEVADGIAEAKTNAKAAHAETKEVTPWESVEKGSKSLLSAFKKLDSAWDEYVRNPVQKGAAFRFRFEALAYEKISDVGRTIFRHGLGHKGDRLLVAGLGWLLYSRTGKVGETLRTSELMRRIDPENPVLIEKSKRPNSANVPTTQEHGTPRDLNPEAVEKRAKEVRAKVQKTL